MKRGFNSTQRNYIIVGLCMILVIMGVGYAAFQSQLKISGTSNIASNFLVKITGIEVSIQSGGAADKPEVTTYNDTSATFGTTLQSPGDSITYDITIENKGSIDATLKTISKTDTNNSAIIFETSGVNEGDTLNVGEVATMQVTVTYNPSVTSQPSNLNSTLKVDLTYEQSDGVVTPPEPSGMTPDDLKALAVTSGDGLYADEYEAGKYTYKGANPNNYITFNNEAWRIISISSDGSLKIMKNEIIEKMAWDSTRSNDWARPSTLNTYLNDTYLATITTNREKIVSHTWSIGEIAVPNSDLAGQISDENGTQSQSARVGMITASEYLRANTNTEQCGNFYLCDANRTTCKMTNWMYNIALSGDGLWTISMYSYEYALYASSTSIYAGNLGPLDVRSILGVSPVVYLSSSTTISGTGTSSDPYIIIN